MLDDWCPPGFLDRLLTSADAMPLTDAHRAQPVPLERWVVMGMTVLTAAPEREASQENSSLDPHAHNPHADHARLVLRDHLDHLVSLDHRVLLAFLVIGVEMETLVSPVPMASPDPADPKVNLVHLDQTDLLARMVS